MSMTGWIPEKLLSIDNAWLCRWLFAGTVPFTDPFFDETILRCKKEWRDKTHFSSLTDMRVFSALAQQCESVPPAAIIFHVSRCGSTLFSQLLGLNPENILLPEVPLFDEILRLENISSEQRAAWLADAIRLHTTARTGTEKRFFIKTDSWHIFFAPVFRKLFPQTPFILLYRSPEAVLRSHQKNRGMQMIPGLIDPELFGFDPATVTQQPADVYTAQVLQRFYETFFAWIQSDTNSILVNYDEGFPQAVWRCCQQIGYALSDDEKQKMIERSRFHAKRPAQAFDETQTAETFSLPPETIAAYAQLEKLAANKKEIQSTTGKP